MDPQAEAQVKLTMLVALQTLQRAGVAFYQTAGSAGGDGGDLYRVIILPIGADPMGVISELAKLGHDQDVGRDADRLEILVTEAKQITEKCRGPLPSRTIVGKMFLEALNDVKRTK